jgi:hypothetical protein
MEETTAQVIDKVEVNDSDLTTEVLQKAVEQNVVLDTTKDVDKSKDT